MYCKFGSSNVVFYILLSIIGLIMNVKMDREWGVFCWEIGRYVYFVYVVCGLWIWFEIKIVDRILYSDLKVIFCGCIVLWFDGMSDGCNLIVKK